MILDSLQDEEYVSLSVDQAVVAVALRHARVWLLLNSGKAEWN